MPDNFFIIIIYPSPSLRKCFCFLIGFLIVIIFYRYLRVTILKFLIHICLSLFLKSITGFCNYPKKIHHTNIQTSDLNILLEKKHHRPGGLFYYSMHLVFHCAFSFNRLSSPTTICVEYIVSYIFIFFTH